MTNGVIAILYFYILCFEMLNNSRVSIIMMSYSRLFSNNCSNSNYNSPAQPHKVFKIK